ncbi:MAG: flagellar hook-length control protein FliK [Deltaproteobacteria bacterium]|nr:flagellar hook-length control protein FliK [Deltaproteobacteria bacterium]
MELSVFGAVNAQGAVARELRKGSAADSNGTGFTEALSECMEPDGSVAPEPRGSGDGQVDTPKDASPHPRRFHNLRKKPCEDTDMDKGFDPKAPLPDDEPLEGATSVKNGDPLPAVGLVLSEGRRPVDPKARGIDKGGKDAQGASILYPMPLYDNGAAVKDASSSPTDPFDPAPASGTSSGEATDGLPPPAGPVEKPASGPAEAGHREAVSKDTTVAAAFTMGAAKGADAKIDIGSVVGVNPGNGALAAPGQADADNADGQGDGVDNGGTEPQAVKGGFPRSERHGMTLSGVSRDTQATGAEPVRFDSNAETVAAPAVQVGSSGSEGSGQSDGNGLEGEGDPKAQFVKDTGPSGTAAFSVDKPAEKTSFDASKNTDTRTRNAAANNDIYDRLDSGLNIAVTMGAKEVSISLHPEHLGAIRIRLNMEDPSSNAVSARITVDSMEVKRVLDTDAGALKEAFSRQGLKLDGYTIELGKNAFGADGGDSYHPNGAGAWGGGGTGGFRDGPAYQGPGGWAAQNGEIKEDAHNGPTPRYARPGGVGSSGVDLFA